MSHMDISLIIATYNGETTLPQQLDSIQRLQVPESASINIIFVDNNSSDKTSELLTSFNCEFEFHYLHEKKPGKNVALNTALNSGIELGQLIIFSDDDVIYPEFYFERYLTLARDHTDFSIFGGKVIAKWPSEPRPEMLNGIDAVVAFAITPESAGYSAGEIDPIKLHGPNMAVRKALFEQGLRFNEDIGPNGGNYVMGSETDILYRLKAKQCKAYFCPELSVQHIIRPVQFTPKWLASRAYKAGRSLVNHHSNQQQQNNISILFGYPRWAVARYAQLTIKLWAHSWSKSENYYRLLWTRNHIRGYLFEFKEQGQGSK
jgi:glycosyltransferase involved in cell wall biosynthesis